MFPMIISVSEIHKIKEMIKEVKAELKEQGIPYKEDVELGVMIETPASVMISREPVSYTHLSGQYVRKIF